MAWYNTRATLRAALGQSPTARLRPQAVVAPATMWQVRAAIGRWLGA